MKRVFFLLLAALAASITSYSQQSNPAQAKKIQVAILLDVSNSMDGLIEQAKSQLWNMVTVLGKAECQGEAPKIEIALYEYGRSTNNVKQGYVKQLSAFTTDLDQLSATLFKLTTDGGDEYCGQVIKSSVEELPWDPGTGSYKVIFIAGNEDFLQGAVQFTESCSLAKQRGIIVNTIYCGDKVRGIAEHWNLGSECGNGSYTNINQNAKEEDIPTPYDSMIYVLNNQLNQTYIAYGHGGAAAYARQAEMDQQNARLSKKAGLARVEVKASRGYNAANWDLVDAWTSDSTIVAKVDRNTLPAEFRNLNEKQLEQKVKDNAARRGRLQGEIGKLNQQRRNYIDQEKARVRQTSQATLESEVEKMLKEQAKRFGIGFRN